MRLAPLAVSVAALLATPALAVPNVVVTIKPLHALVAGVMDGVGEPALLIDGAASPHGFALRPSDAQALEAADIVFWIGPGMETFLEAPLASLAADADTLALIDVEGMELLPLREDGLFEGHDHKDHAEVEHADETRSAADAHLWLDPDNARLMVAAIAQALIAADPENTDSYNANGMALTQEISRLDAEIAASLTGLGDAAWFVFHDAYHAFEAHYGIEATGTFTVNPEIAPGAARLIEIRDTITAAGGACIFAEPQFSPAVIDTIAAETGAQIGVLDPLGADLEPGPELYATLMRNLAANLADCLRR